MLPTSFYNIVFDFTCVVNVTKMYINVVRNGYNNPKRVRLDVLDDAENWVDSQVLDIPSIAGPIGISVSETRCRYLRFYVLSTYNEGSQAYVREISFELNENELKIFLCCLPYIIFGHL